MVNLGIIRTQRFHPEGSYQLPNGKWEPMVTDDGQSLAVNERKTLAWNGGFGKNKEERHVLVFVPSFQSWPGLQPVTIVLTDGSFRVLSWVENGESNMFRLATLKTVRGEWVLATWSTVRSGGQDVEEFRFMDDKIHWMDRVAVGRGVEPGGVSRVIPRKRSHRAQLVIGYS